MKPLHFLVGSLLLFILLSGCALQPETRDAPEGEMPPLYAVVSDQGTAADRWWETLRDPELTLLIEEALKRNFGIRQAWARLRQARAAAVQAGAARYPDLTLDAGAAAARQGSDTGTVSDTRSVEEYGAGLASSYEVDLWGRIRSEREAAELAADASRGDLETAAMTLAATVAERWAGIVSRRIRLDLLRQQLETNRTYLELVELRFRKSMVSALDVFQQRQVVEAVQAQIPVVEAEERLLLHDLAVLLGYPPRREIAITRMDLPFPETLPQPGIPADLLARRPDIRAAALRLRAADFQVAAARADLLPAIRLSASASFGADDLELLLDNWIARIAADLAAPLLDGGRRRAEVDRTQGVADERLWGYRNVVYTAIREVEDALVSESKRREHIRMLEQQMDTANAALNQAVERYRKGLSDYLPVLTQLLAVQGLERDMVVQHAALISDRIQLHRALGGEWTRNIAMPDAPGNS